VLKVLKGLYNHYFIHFSTPAYKYTGTAEDKKLETLGISMGKRFKIGDKKGSHVHRQPLCLFSFFDILFSDNPFFPHKEERVIEMLNNSLDYGHSLIQGYFREKGIDLLEVLHEREGLWLAAE